jgi:hypothetical protein
MELRLETRLISEYPDFAAGFKSVIMNKKSPAVWSHKQVSQVDEKVVKTIFSPFNQPELELAL